MEAEGNLWASLWDQARAVPARRQRRLFDDTREAEKVVGWVAGLAPGEAAHLLLPTLLQAGHLRLLEATPARGEEEVEELHRRLAEALQATSRLPCLAEVQHYQGRVHREEFERREEGARIRLYLHLCMDETSQSCSSSWASEGSGIGVGGLLVQRSYSPS